MPGDAFREPVNAGLLDLVLERLVEDGSLDDDSRELVLAACEGDEAVEAALGGTWTAPAREQAAAGEPMGAYLAAVTVEGFRGIGPATTLAVPPGPGLTLVVGRNGSGKSSFAEGLELLLTGDSLRWKGRSRVWADGWRNLHHAGPAAIEAVLAVEGVPGNTVVRREWCQGADLAGASTWCQRPGAARHPLEALGWGHALEVFRPFLSYNELGSMLDEGPSKLYDALSTMLGLEDLVLAAQTLRDARLSADKAAKRIAAGAKELAGRMVGLDDERAAPALAALASRPPDLAAVRQVLTAPVDTGADGSLALLQRLASIAGPDPGDCANAASTLRSAGAAVRAAAGTDAGRALALARLLEQALEFHGAHPGADCPVCGIADALDADWRDSTVAQLERLRAEASAAMSAEQRLQAATARARRLLTAPPDGLARGGDVGVDEAEQLERLWRDWASVDVDDLEAVAVRLESAGPVANAATVVRDRASAERARREDRWQPLATDLAVWLGEAVENAPRTARLGALKRAESWVKETAGLIRDERFEPIADRARALWAMLRQQSNVDLGAVKLSGASTQRRVMLDVTVDDVPGAALGVMSQGELHCLALSLFLPRATMAESPFRFLVIDDPVQAMDPARVDGLAHVLRDVAASRQVLVFTHDDRLPEAVRRLGIDATVVEVTRTERSVVALRPSLTPSRRALDDAFALAKTDTLPAKVANRVVPGLCRLALEAACTEVVRRRRIGRGEPHAAVEQLLEASLKLAPRLALALFDDASAAGRVPDEIERRWGRSKRDVYFRANRGAHQGDAAPDLLGFVRNAEALVAGVLGHS